MKRNTKLLLVLVAATAASASGCTGGIEEDDNTLPPGTTVGGEDNTFDHDNSGMDPFELLDRLQQEGPPKYSSRVHACTKPRYRTIGNILASRGVNLAGGGQTAGGLYQSGYNALGGPNYGARIRENVDVTTSGASRLFDIFVQAAPEIIANLSTRPECQIGGVGVELFNTSNQCSAAGITCLIGVPATAQHLELCNFAITEATDVDSGKRIAVAALLAAAHTCD